VTLEGKFAPHPHEEAMCRPRLLVKGRKGAPEFFALCDEAECASVDHGEQP